MPNVEKISVALTSEQMTVLREVVANGEFASTSEALRDAFRVWQRQRREDEQRMKAIQARVRESLADTRPSLSADEAEAEMSRFVKERTAAAHENS